ncbi:MAG: ATP:cob(I)alamin adenosyltransferase [Bifidobacteriaceae bacterium]|nr:ATP:cob(I)alamin adenosyltransferase [Bifidobacteriaceae bacterium]
MVVLSRIATKTGDAGTTSLADASRVAKTDPRVGAIGAVAELGAVIGLARSAGLAPRLDRWAERILQELFDLGADLATPLPPAADAADDADGASPDDADDAVPDAADDASPDHAPDDAADAADDADDAVPDAADDSDDDAAPAGRPRAATPRIANGAISAWEQVIAQLAAELGPLRSFILPGGPPAAAQLHLAAAVARRAERAAWAAAEAHGIGQTGGLSHDALRYLNRLSDLLFQMARAAGGQTELWRPGGRTAEPSRGADSSGRIGPAGAGLDP